MGQQGLASAPGLHQPFGSHSTAPPGKEPLQGVIAFRLIALPAIRPFWQKRRCIRLVGLTPNPTSAALLNLRPCVGGLLTSCAQRRLSAALCFNVSTSFCYVRFANRCLVQREALYAALQPSCRCRRCISFKPLPSQVAIRLCPLPAKAATFGSQRHEPPCCGAGHGLYSAVILKVTVYPFALMVSSTCRRYVHVAEPSGDMM